MLLQLSLGDHKQVVSWRLSDRFRDTVEIWGAHTSSVASFPLVAPPDHKDEINGLKTLLLAEFPPASWG